MSTGDLKRLVAGFSTEEMMRLVAEVDGELKDDSELSIVMGWAEDDEWELIAAELVNWGILVPIEADEIVKVEGRRVLSGLFGVRKSGHAKGSGLVLAGPIPI